MTVTRSGSGEGRFTPTQQDQALCQTPATSLVDATGMRWFCVQMRHGLGRAMQAIWGWVAQPGSSSTHAWV